MPHGGDVAIDLLGDPIDPTAEPVDRWPERYAEIVDLLLAEIRERGAAVPPAEARMLACGFVARLCASYGGAAWYVPKADTIERIARNARIWAEHDGTAEGPRGIRALARRYRLSDQQVWAILRTERARHLRWVQPELEGLEKAVPG